MINEKSVEVLQSLLQYYRTKCSQLEYEFLLFKINAELQTKESKAKE